MIFFMDDGPDSNHWPSLSMYYGPMYGPGLEAMIDYIIYNHFICCNF